MGLTVGACRETTMPTAPSSRMDVSQVVATWSLAQVAAAGRWESRKGDAITQLQRAVAGRTARGYQDDMLRIEAAAPGFGGFYLDADERVVLLVKAQSATAPAHLRALVHGQYKAHSSRVVRSLMADAGEAVVRPVRYSLSELVEYEQRFLEVAGGVPGLTGFGLNISQNRLLVDVVDVNAAKVAAGIVRTVGIPDSAVTIGVTGPTNMTATWSDPHRPTKGGVLIELYDGRYDPNPQTTPPTRVSFMQSLGFNVRLMDVPGTPTAFLTVAHGPNGWYAQNGATGMAVYQPHNGYGSIGTITDNPPWWTGATCTGTGTYYDFCTTADAALGTYAAGVSGQRAVGASTTQGNDGNAGSATVNGWYAISDIVPADLMPTGRRNIFKSGYRTGTTSGTYNGVSHYYASDTLLGWGNPASNVHKRVLFWEQVKVDSMGYGFGDSGGAGFVAVTKNGACSPYCAFGIESTARGAVSPITGLCTAGKMCSVVFSVWAEIASVLQRGQLNPRTTP